MGGAARNRDVLAPAQEHQHPHPTTTTTTQTSRGPDRAKMSSGGSSKSLIVGIVATVVSVILFFGLILVLALWWQQIARRIAPNRFAEPPSEKAWPQSRPSTDTNLTMMTSSPNSSPRNSAMSSSPPA
ncbi:hypothetical protein GGR57DRAFT_508916 [Xylariaceae sp. FL1272]|nr:hypothetical protein GGR57DRAFT_508916 [Xylariaceae sp. FL1272]